MAPFEVPPPEYEARFEAVYSAAARRDLPALLDMLASLDGLEECAVVRSAIEGGVSYDVALAEVQREVERRLERALREDA